MTRSVATVAGLLAALVLAVSAGAADAKGRNYSKKKCLPPDRAQSWVCSAAETCCWDYKLQKGTCTTGTLSCL